MTDRNDNSGTLNPVDEKRGERSPDWYGRLQISGEVLEALKAGKQIRLAGWSREGRYGRFISLKADLERPREQAQDYDVKAAEQRERARQQPIAAGVSGDFDDDIPF